MLEISGAKQVQHQRRIVQAQQRLRVTVVAQHHQLVTNAVRVVLLQPGPGGGQQCRQLGRLAKQGLRLRAADHLSQRAAGLVKNGLWQAKGCHQLARRTVANAGGQRQAQPGSQFLAFHGVMQVATVRQLGLTRWSPTLTPLVMSSTSA